MKIANTDKIGSTNKKSIVNCQLSIVNYILLIVFLFFSVNLHAQRGLFDGFEVGLSGSGGLSALHFTTVDKGKFTNSVGYAFGWEVGLLFTDGWSLRTGVNMASYKASVFFDQLETRTVFNETPGGYPLGSRYYRVFEHQQYEELHEALLLRFPLMVQYQATQRFYVAAGIQTGILANSSYRLRSDEFSIKGYSDFTDQYYEDFKQEGFNSYSKRKSANKLDFGVALSGVLETGLKWNLNNGMALYTGVFIDYGINDFRKNAPIKRIVEYSQDNDHAYNSIIFSQNNGEPMTSKVKPVAAGLRLRLNMGFKKINN